MKILTVIFDLNKGGTQRAAQVFAEAYKKLGHDSRVLVFYGLGQRYDEIKDFIKIWYKNSDENLAEIKEWGPDIIHIHSHGLNEKDVDYMLDALQNEDVKVIEQNVFSIPSPWEKRLDFSFQLSSWALWLYIMRGGDIYKSVIVPNPINPAKFYQKNIAEVNDFKKIYNIPENAFVIGRIGQASYGKWSLMLVDCFNKLAKQHDNLYMVVVNPPINLIKKINKSPFNDRIINIEKIYGDDALSVAYSSFDLMVHIAEQGESFGYVLAESLLCETPVVTLSTPWGDNSQCEVVGNLRGGYVVNSYHGVTDAIEHYINNESSRIFKKNGRENICSNYDYIKLANMAIEYVSSEKNNIQDKRAVIKQKINFILKDTFDKTSLLTIFLINSRILCFRRLTFYRYPIKILLIKIFKKFIFLDKI